MTAINTWDASTPEEQTEIRRTLQVIMDILWDADDPLAMLETMRPLITLPDGRIPSGILAGAHVMAEIRKRMREKKLQ